MEKEIKNKLRQVAKEKGVKILFAVENGSRVWGMESENSDYDVRGVYYRPLDEYLTVRPKRDVINMQTPGALIDIQLFDIFKYAKLLSSSNPTIIEWLISNIQYTGTRPKEFIEFALTQFNPLTLYHHYKSMAKTNYMKYIHSGALVTYKKYLYVFRGIVNSMYVSQHRKVPPIKLEEAISAIEMPEYIKIHMLRIIALKRQGEEQSPALRIDELDEFIQNQLDLLTDEPMSRKNATSRAIDKVIQEVLRE